MLSPHKSNMPSDLASYLATNYLVADPKPKSKKRKRKDKDGGAGLLITDDDETGWGKAPGHDDDPDDGPVTVSGTSAEFRRAKKSAWKTVGAQGQPAAGEDAAAAAAADAILASAAAENEAARQADDDLPVVEDETGAVKMSDGTHAGLQSAASVSAQLRRRQREERADFERHRQTATEQETIYRDATGRRVDVSMKRAEARRAAAEAEDKERRAKEALKGEVQMEQARQRRELLDEARYMTVARGADDVEMNRELREQERWNDPMAQFTSEQQREAKKTKGGKSKRRPLYTGPAAPNRYGIRPGYRWDGVDRGNGFEAERFQALRRRERNKDLSYEWQMDE